jgi:hypothetical protein
MLCNDARRDFSCLGGDSFIGGNVIFDRFNRLCLPVHVRFGGRPAQARTKQGLTAAAAATPKAAIWKKSSTEKPKNFKYIIPQQVQRYEADSWERTSTVSTRRVDRARP